MNDRLGYLMCAHASFTGQHTDEFYKGGACRCCKTVRSVIHDLMEADDFYAELRERLAERAPA